VVQAALGAAKRSERLLTDEEIREAVASVSA